mmetsp:Transcript_2422/g.6253  ORF Transcript_2422/g.6253 Transcript_2422/m.6253 type:complete len:237 (-) Transcript_2422:499-1209(-)
MLSGKAPSRLKENKQPGVNCTGFSSCSSISSSPPSASAPSPASPCCSFFCILPPPSVPFSSRPRFLLSCCLPAGGAAALSLMYARRLSRISPPALPPTPSESSSLLAASSSFSLGFVPLALRSAILLAMYVCFFSSRRGALAYSSFWPRTFSASATLANSTNREPLKLLLTMWRLMRTQFTGAYWAKNSVSLSMSTSMGKGFTYRLRASTSWDTTSELPKGILRFTRVPCWLTSSA